MTVDIHNNKIIDTYVWLVSYYKVQHKADCCFLVELAVARICLTVEEYYFQNIPHFTLLDHLSLSRFGRIALINSFAQI